MNPTEMADLERQVLFGLLVHGKAEVKGYEFRTHATSGSRSVSLSYANDEMGKEIRREPLGAVMSLISYFLYLIQVKS